MSTLHMILTTGVCVAALAWIVTELFDWVVTI